MPARLSAGYQASVWIDTKGRSKLTKKLCMPGDVGRIQIEHDLVRRFGVRLDEQAAEQRVDLLRRVVDLVVELPAANKRKCAG